MSESGARNAPLDFLRGVAILVVLLLHFSLTYHLTASPLATLLSPRMAGAVARNGNYGVTMFFVISGFLITSISISRYGSLRRLDLASFYVFRLGRILPSLVLALAIITVLGCLGVQSFTNSGGGHPFPSAYFVVAVVSVLTFWHNVLMESVGYFNYCLNIYWSLSVEEVFYLAFPLVCVLVRRDALLAVLCIALIVIGPLYRSRHADDELFFMYGYLACFDAIAFGCLVALLARRVNPSPARGRWLRTLAGLALAAVYLRGIEGNEIWGFTEIAAATAVILFSVAHGSPDGWMTGRTTGVLRWMGRHSYELYLFHILVLAGMRDVIPRERVSYAAKLPLLLVFLGLAALVAALVSRLVAEPVNQALRQHFLRSRAAIGQAMGRAPTVS
jgi:peptidoglycan/LPS O-acetylase OafA/YrhL